jgi:hypothetical protein
VNVPSSARGKKVRCPRCQKLFPTLPAGAAPTPAGQSRIPTPVNVVPLGEAPPLIESSPPPVGSLGWVLPRLSAGLVLGGGAGYLLDLYRKALVVRDSAEQQNTLLLVLIAWACAGMLAALLGWLYEPRARRGPAPWLLIWLFGGALAGAGLGWAGANAGFWTGGPMGLVYGMGALGAGLGLMFGWIGGGDFGRALAGAFVGATLGEAMAATSLVLGLLPEGLPYLAGLGALLGALWALALSPMLRLPLPGVLTSVIAVAAAGGVLLRFTLADTGLVHRFEGHTRTVRALAFTPDGTKVISGSDDETVRLWEVESGEEVKKLRGFQKPVLQVLGRPGNKEVMAGCSAGTLRRWHLNDNLPAEPIASADAATCLAFSADGHWALWGSAEGRVSWHDLQTMKAPVTIEIHGGRVHAVALSRTGRRAASAGADGKVCVWESLTNPPRVLKGHGEARALAFSFDERFLVTGGEDGMVRVWNVETGEETQRMQGHRGAVTCVAFASDGLRVLSGGRDRTVRLWHVNTESLLRRYEGHAEPVSAVLFSPDGQRVLSASEDGTLCLWRLPP